MTTDVARISGHTSTVAAIAASIASADSITDLHEARARVEAIKAWAKVHKQTKALRLDLLRIEVAALVRIVELGGLSTLATREQKAAGWLASLTPEERERLLQNSGSATTATGMCQSVWTEEEVRNLRRAQRARGRSFAEAPPIPETESAVASAERRVNMAAAIRSVITDRLADGEAFEAADLAADVLLDVGNGESWSEDEAVIAGVKEVVREALRRQPVLTLDGLIIPRVLVALLSDGKYVRIPTESATVAHLDSAIQLRAEQIAADQAALKKLSNFRRMLGAQPPERRIGQIIADSIRTTEATAEAS